MASCKPVALCAPCHSRRAILGDYTHAEPDLSDSMLPSLLTPELYFADGQILEEVYVVFKGNFILKRLISSLSSLVVSGAEMSRE